jgi:peptide deformylase
MREQFNLKLVDKDDPILSTVTPEFVGLPSPSLIKNMYEIMKENRGIGLAAPQVGLPYRIFVLYYTNLKFEDRVVINPVVLESDTETFKFDEGCLSFKGVFKETNRSKKIKVRYTNLLGETVERVFKDIWSVCFQHELDHLNGITFNNS